MPNWPVQLDVSLSKPWWKKWGNLDRLQSRLSMLRCYRVRVWSRHRNCVRCKHVSITLPPCADSLLDSTQVAEPCLDMWGCPKGGFQLSCRENLSSLQFSMSHLPIPLPPSQVRSQDANRISVNDTEVVSNQSSKGSPKHDPPYFSSTWGSCATSWWAALTTVLDPMCSCTLWDGGQWLMMALSLVHSSAPHL